MQWPVHDCMCVSWAMWRNAEHTTTGVTAQTLCHEWGPAQGAAGSRSREEESQTALGARPARPAATRLAPCGPAGPGARSREPGVPSGRAAATSLRLRLREANITMPHRKTLIFNTTLYMRRMCRDHAP